MLGVFVFSVHAPWASSVAYQLDAQGRVLGRSIGNHVADFQEEMLQPLARSVSTKTMELKQEVGPTDGTGSLWVNQTLRDKFFEHYLDSDYHIAADGSTIRNIQTGSDRSPHADYMCQKQAKDNRIECKGSLLNQPIEYSVTYDRTNQLPVSVNGFDVIAGLQTTVFRHGTQGLQVSLVAT
jgi:hypothetical protein